MQRQLYSSKVHLLKTLLLCGADLNPSNTVFGAGDGTLVWETFVIFVIAFGDASVREMTRLTFKYYDQPKALIYKFR